MSPSEVPSLRSSGSPESGYPCLFPTSRAHPTGPPAPRGPGEPASEQTARSINHVGVPRHGADPGRSPMLRPIRGHRHGIFRIPSDVVGTPDPDRTLEGFRLDPPGGACRPALRPPGPVRNVAERLAVGPDRRGVHRTRRRRRRSTPTRVLVRAEAPRYPVGTTRPPGPLATDTGDVVRTQRFSMSLVHPDRLRDRRPRSPRAT
jgi:hypothetical protein